MAMVWIIVQEEWGSGPHTKQQKYREERNPPVYSADVGSLLCKVSHDEVLEEGLRPGTHCPRWGLLLFSHSADLASLQLLYLFVLLYLPF
jgi:hypothetical protein